MITRTFKLCLNAGTGSAPYINVSQYDEGETWLFELYSENGERYIPSSGAIVGVKSDGHGIVNTGTVDSEGRVVIAETQQMTASAGRAIYELSIDGLTHGTANFIVAVERKPTDEAVMSDSDLSLIQEAIDSAEVIVEVIGDSDPSEVIGEHVDDWLDNHPEATTTVEDGAITAPKINNSLWDKLLVNEEASGAVASFDDGADDVPVSSLKVALEPVQLGSGDPSPSNVRPIYPSNGKNYLDTATTTSDYITYTQGADYYITASPSNSDTRGWSYANCQYKFTLPAGTYKFVWDVRTPSTVGGRGYRVLDSAGTILADGYGATLDTNGASSAFTLNESTNVGVMLKQYEMVARFMIVQSSESNVYVPYQGIMVERKGINLFDASVANHGKRWKSAGLETMSNVSASAKIPCLPNTDYYLHDVAGENNGVPAVYFWDADNTYISNVVIQGTSPVSQMVTSPANAAYMGINYMTAQESTVGVNCNGVTEYVSYEGEKYPYTLGQSVYGGTVDLATGVLTVTKVCTTLTGNENWAYYRSGGSTEYNNYKVTAPTIFGGQVLTACGSDTRNNAICSDYVCNDSLAYSYTGNAFIISSPSNSQLLIISTNQANTVANFKTYLANNAVQVCATLVDPLTIQLTPTEVKTLLGYNNISSSGTVDVIYHADTKLYVDKLTAVDNAIIAPTEADFVATRNYTVNDLVIVNDTLYKVTSNIQNGGTITPNGNVTQTTLSALIKALS